MKNIMVYVIATFTILMDVLMVIYCYKETGIIKLRLSDLLFMPDIQARAMQENAEKMKYVVEMARKKFDVDLQGIVTDRSRFKKRQNSKMPVLG